VIVLVDTLQVNQVSVLLDAKLIRLIILPLKLVSAFKDWVESMAPVISAQLALGLPLMDQDVHLVHPISNLSMEYVLVHLALLLIQHKSALFVQICRTVSYLTAVVQFALEP
jgi:hypothetical protein